MKPLRTLSGAEEEITDACAFYEGRRPGLGRRFLAAIDATFTRIAAMPDTFPLWRADRPFRKVLVKRFPFVVFYRIVEGAVEVVAIAHVKRRPGYWARR